MTEPAAALDVLIQRLRRGAAVGLPSTQLCTEAADTLAAQAAKIDRLSGDKVLLIAQVAAALRHELCASCADTADGYGQLAGTLGAIEAPLGLRDGSGSFVPRITRIVATLQAQLAEVTAERDAQVREAFLAGRHSSQRIDGSWVSAPRTTAHARQRDDEAFAAFIARAAEAKET